MRHVGAAAWGRVRRVTAQDAAVSYPPAAVAVSGQIKHTAISMLIKHTASEWAQSCTNEWEPRRAASVGPSRRYGASSHGSHGSHGSHDSHDSDLQRKDAARADLWHQD